MSASSPRIEQGGTTVTAARHTLVGLIAPTAAALALSAPAYAAGTRAGATHAAKRHTIAHVERYGIFLRTSDLDLQCSTAGRSRWRCFVYVHGGPCTGSLSQAYSTRARAYRRRNIDIGWGRMMSR